MAASPTLVAYRTLFASLGCFMLATLVYTLLTDGSPFRRELFTPWMVATLLDFYANVLAIAVWVAYKESTWNAVLWVLLLVCFGRNDGEQKMKCSSVLFGRILFSILGVIMLAVVIYTLATDGFPFRKELLTPWMSATLIDFYINVVAISVWIAHRESTWIGAFFWICLLICFGSITTCAYIAIQLFCLPHQDPMYHVLLDSHSKHK